MPPNNPSTSNNAGRFKPGQSGNPSGKAPGTRNHTTRALDAILDGEAEALTRKAVEMALSGDAVAMRMCLDRLAPVRRDRTIEFEMPEIASAKDVSKATGALLAGVGRGEITPSEAAELGKLVQSHMAVLTQEEVLERLARLEGTSR